MSNILTEIITNLLGEKQAQIYLAALKLGPSPIGPIAQQANIPRSSTYLIIDELVDKNILTKLSQNNKTIITAQQPEKLITYAQHQLSEISQIQTQLTDIMPQLKALNNSNLQQPTVKYFQGIQGIKTVLEDTYSAPEILVLCSGYNHPVEPQLDDILENYYQNIFSKNISTYEILGESQDTQEYIDAYSSKKNQMKMTKFLIDRPIHHIDKLIYQDKLAIISFEYLNATVIQHQPIVNFEKAQFFKLWEQI